MASNIGTVTARERLKAQHEPHWQKLKKGAYLGFQKLTPNSTGSWIARYRQPDTGKQHKKALGDFADRLASERFDLAVKAATSWFEHLGMGGSTETVTIKRVCDLYVEHVRSTKGDAAADDMKGRYRRWVDEAPLGKLELTKATRVHFRAWRASLAKTPAKVNRDKRDKPVTRERSPGTVNRDVTALRAALNWAKDEGHVTTDMAWAAALRPTENADGRRDAYLDREQRRKLLEKAAPDVAAFLRGLALVPLRPGALASLDAGHFEKRLGVLTIGKDKAGADRRITLPQATAAVFAAATKDKLPSAPLFARADGKRWDKDAWKGPVKAAAAAANLPPTTTAYALRHSVITDLVTGGLDLATVAQISGTSVAMIEKHYKHLRSDHATSALAALAL